MKRKKKTSRQRAKPALLIAQILLVGLLMTAVYFLFLNDRSDWEKELPPPGRAIKNTLELQIALARVGFSPGSIDGRMGKQTIQALVAFQESRGLEVTGELDASLDRWLRIEEPTHAYIELPAESLSKLTPIPNSWRERGQLSRFGYHTALEMVAEKTFADPDYIRSINPQINWANLLAGDRVLAPLVLPYRMGQRVQRIQIELEARQLQAFGAEDELIFHCPVSIARDVAKRPVGELKVEVRVKDPNYTFNPNILTATAEREGITEKFVIQPGPNNPVGTVWLGLNRPSYGIHGTPVPEKVGRTESSGCFRLANWNAETLLAATDVGYFVTLLLPPPKRG